MADTQNRGLMGALMDWYAHPFNSQGSALNWVLFVGLLLVIVLFWQLVLLEITKEV